MVCFWIFYSFLEEVISPPLRLHTPIRIGTILLHQSSWLCTIYPVLFIIFLWSAEIFLVAIVFLISDELPYKTYDKISSWLVKTAITKTDFWLLRFGYSETTPAYPYSLIETKVSYAGVVSLYPNGGWDNYVARRDIILRVYRWFVGKS